MLATALAYAARGLRVFPLRPREKRPANSNGCTGASTEPDEIRRLWVDPACNVGVAAGIDSGVLVLDIDGPDGRRTLTTWQAFHGALPPTPTVETASGMHLYFRHPGEQCPIRNSARKAGDGIDVRTDGGYVVAPPSVHPDGPTYEWVAGRSIDDVAFADAPDWLIAKLTDKPAEPAPAYEPSARSDYGHTRYGQRALDEECMELARHPEGGRNQKLNEVAFRIGQLVSSGHLVEGSAINDLYRAAKSCGLDERETRATIASGLKAGLAKPCSSDPSPNEQKQSYSFERGNEPAATDAPDAPSETKWAHEAMQASLDHYSDATRHKLPRTGFAKLDDAIGGLKPGSLFTLGGRTGAGKSSLLLSMALRQSKQALRVGIVSCEDPDTVWGDRLLAAIGRINMRPYLNAEMPDDVKGQARAAIAAARDRGVLFRFTMSPSVAAVCKHIESLVTRDSCNVIHVDYLQAISAKGQDRYTARTDALQEIKALCYRLGVAVVVASQLKRPENGNPFREPTNNDLKDSGDIENMSEVILLLWPKSDDGGALVLGKVTKVKWSAERPKFAVTRDEQGTIDNLVTPPFEAPKRSGDEY